MAWQSKDSLLVFAARHGATSQSATARAPFPKTVHAERHVALRCLPDDGRPRDPARVPHSSSWCGRLVVVPCSVLPLAGVGRGRRRGRVRVAAAAGSDAVVHAGAAEAASRRSALQAAGGCAIAATSIGPPAQAKQPQAAADKPRTNEIVDTVDGIRWKRLGGGSLVVSEIGLGTQRWVSADFNAPDEAACHALMDRAILGSGVNLIDTAEQYPIPSDDTHPEGLCEEVIGRWAAKEAGRRRKIVIATKITGGFNVTRDNIGIDCETSLQRLGTDYIDLYQLHWPARYSPQANWGQSLEYKYEAEDLPYLQGASFEEICLAMDKLLRDGKIRSWGLCNDNAFGLTACCEVAKRLRVPGPICAQGDYSLLDRKSEENGLFEASSPINENTGFLAYNALAGGMLTGKYLEVPAAGDIRDRARAAQQARSPRGRHDDADWGPTLYRYRSGPAKAATRAYADLARRQGMSLTEFSLRWCCARRGCTSVLLGTANQRQLEEDLSYFRKGPLPQNVRWEVDRIHMRNRLPIFSSDDVGADWDGVGEIGEPIP